jgi:tetratricopeptide (TPR) repeat protein
VGFTFRKSFKIMPGVRMTVSPRGISTSAGVRGFRVSRSSSGRLTRTVSLPGTGLRHTETIGSSSRRGSRARRGGAAAPRAAAPTASPAASPPKPGLFAPKWEKELYHAVKDESWSELERIAARYPDAAGIAVTLDAFCHLGDADPSRAASLLARAWSEADDIGADRFVRTYLSGSRVTINVAEGVHVTLPIDRDAIGLALAEAEQAIGDTDAAIRVVEQLDPSAVAAVSLCELYLDSGRYDDVIDVTDGVVNADDPSALLLTFRGAAFREQGLYTAARESLRAALASRQRDPAIRHRALMERSSTYIAEGKISQARKDLERILAEDSDYEGIRGLIATLS